MATGAKAFIRTTHAASSTPSTPDQAAEPRHRQGSRCALRAAHSRSPPRTGGSIWTASSSSSAIRTPSSLALATERRGYELVGVLAADRRGSRSTRCGPEPRALRRQRRRATTCRAQSRTQASSASRSSRIAGKASLRVRHLGEYPLVEDNSIAPIRKPASTFAAHGSPATSRLRRGDQRLRRGRQGHGVLLRPTSPASIRSANGRRPRESRGRTAHGASGGEVPVLIPRPGEEPRKTAKKKLKGSNDGEKRSSRKKARTRRITDGKKSYGVPEWFRRSGPS